MQKLFQVIYLSIVVGVITSGCLAPVAERVEITEIASGTEVSSPSIEIPTETQTPVPSNTKIPADTFTPSPTKDSETVIAFTGVIVPARCVQAGIEERGTADYLYKNVREILESADITVGVYNATMRSGVPYMGCVRSWELIGGIENADALKNAGFNLVSVATNHIKDCGFRSCGDAGFFETIENFQRVGIETVGGGANVGAALEPVVIEVNGVRFGFVSLGEVNEKVFAGALTPGIAPLTRDNLQAAIENARSRSDVVIVLPHSGPEDYPEVTPQQKYWARNSVALGADLVVINHAHILQGYQFLEGVPVFFSLGNFVFDQVWARDHQQGAILLVTFQDGEITGFELVPTVVEQDGTVFLAEGDERVEILTRVEELSEALNQE